MAVKGANDPIRADRYDIENYRRWLGGGEGQLAVRNVRAKAAEAFKSAGSVTYGRLHDAAGCSDSWKSNAAVDLLGETGELREITAGQEMATQHRVFVPGREWRAS